MLDLPLPQEPVSAMLLAESEPCLMRVAMAKATRAWEEPRRSSGTGASARILTWGLESAGSGE